MGELTAGWIFEWVGLISFLAMGTWVVVDTARNRRLSFVSLAMIAGTTMWWQEWYGDWGSYLIYNEDFALIPWGSTLWTTPNKPWSLIPAYGWYYAVALPGTLWLVGRLRQIRPTWGRVTTVVVVVLPIFYIYDVIVEVLGTYWGWWSYTESVGPAIHSAKGTFPLLFPLAFVCLFVVSAVLLIDNRDDRGHPRFEGWFGVTRVRAGWPQELTRVGVWIVVFNVTYLVTLIGPLVAIRELFGPSSAIVP